MDRFFRASALLFTCCFITNIVSALPYHCPKNNSYIAIGDSVEQIIQKCGEPLYRTILPAPAVKVDVIRYIYDYEPNSGVRKTIQATQMTKSALEVTFINDQATFISVKGIPTTSTNFCRSDIPLALGDTQQKTYQICRNPTLKQTTTEIRPDPSVKKESLIYSNDTSKMTLIFTNDQLTNIEN